MVEAGPTSGDSSLLRTANLLARAHAGDERARTDLFERYRPALHRFVQARLLPSARRVHDPEDLVQDVIARALEHLPRFEHRGAGSFWAYLRTVARHHVIEVSRRADHPVGGGPLPDDSRGVPPAPGPGPSTLLLRREQSEAFEKALESLTEKHREALLARLELGLDYRSIAEGLGFPSADAARMAICRAIVRVGEEMSRAGFTG